MAAVCWCQMACKRCYPGIDRDWRYSELKPESHWIKPVPKFRWQFVFCDDTVEENFSTLVAEIYRNCWPFSGLRALVVRHSFPYWWYCSRYLMALYNHLCQLTSMLFSMAINYVDYGCIVVAPPRLRYHHSLAHNLNKAKVHTNHEINIELFKWGVEKMLVLTICTARNLKQSIEIIIFVMFFSNLC